MAATLFFGSPVGFAAGGTAMLLDLRSIAFPDTQFRASFAQPLKDSGVNLCGQQGPAPPPHARRLHLGQPDSQYLHSLRFASAMRTSFPLTQKTPVPVDVPEPAWKYLDRAREWALVSDQHKKTPVPS